MAVHLYHPATGGEFDADDKAVPHWLRSGWQIAAERDAALGASLENGTGPAAGPAAGKGQPAQVTTKE
jgi:hypothetical protein